MRKQVSKILRKELPKHEQDLELMKLVIAHWRRLERCILNRDYEALRKEGFCSGSCAFCAAYSTYLSWDEDVEIDCHGCPIAVEAKEYGCIGTPYHRAASAILPLTRPQYNEDPYDALIGTEHMIKWLKDLQAKLKVSQQQPIT